jgi:tRNA pseudouridine32 synthase/23S rRNA pseudouridine746 synthase
VEGAFSNGVDCCNRILEKMKEEEIQARLLYRDGLMLVLDKPAGIAVHKGPQSKNNAMADENLEAYFTHLRFGLPRSPALVHRLDKDTAGCLVLGRHHKALEKLGLLFKQGKIKKTYWAVVEGVPEQDHGLIDLPLGRLDASRGWWMKVDSEGQPAQTEFSVHGRGDGLAFLELKPLTGRTHQLRVHCAALGWPIVGDRVYGTGQISGEPLHLQARSIEIPLYKNKPPIFVQAPVPQHMDSHLRLCGAPIPDRV